jgi:AcrR family transcriptional regulator
VSRAGLDRAKVVALAAEVADAEGLEAVTVARVAAGLGVRAPSLYNHVEGRGALLDGVAAAGMRDLVARIGAAGVGRSGEAALLAAARAYRAYALEHPGRYAAAQRAPAVQDGALATQAAELVAVLAGLLRAWGLEGEDATHAIRGLRSALHGFVDLERSGGFRLPAALDESFDRLVLAFAAGLSRASGSR